MKKIELSPLEKEMLNFNFDEVQSHANAASAKIASAQNVGDVKDQICQVWSKIGKFVKAAEAIPVIGKYITILATLLDTICAA